MKIFSSAGCFAALLLMIAGCSKGSSGSETPVPTKTDIIGASAWTYQDGGIDNNRDGVVDANGSFSVLLPSLVPACRTDNTITFKKDNTGTVDEGLNKCNSTDAQTTAFNWSFADNEATLNMSNNVFGLLNGKSKIVALTAAQFTLTRDTTFGGTTVPVVVILKH